MTMAITTTATTIPINTISGSNGYVVASSSSYVTYPAIVSDNNSLRVTGDTSIEGNLTVGGTNVTELLQKIQDRLAILTPDPAKLEKYKALREAYNHYLLLEKMIGDD